MKDKKQLVIVIPCYNEEETIEYTANKLSEKLNSLISDNMVSDDSKICFVNDGSEDKTLEVLNKLAENNKKIAIINLTRNYGQQYALLAGMKTVSADMVITLDADLQDNIDVIDEMINKYHAGYDIVYGCRKKRNCDTFLKKYTAEMFYKLMKFFCPKIYYNHADYRLMNRRALTCLFEYSEKSVFLRGLVPHIGLNAATVFYDRTARLLGHTKYNYSKMFEFAWQGIMDYSVFPIRCISVLGVSFVTLSLIFFALFLFCYIKSRYTNSSLLVINFMLMLSGVILFAIGLIGEYIGKILYEVKNRPLFQIESTKNLE